MGYHIIMDSVGDRTKELVSMDNFSVVPLTIFIDNEEFIDDGSIEQGLLLAKIASAKQCPRSACGSPEEYMKIFEKYPEDRIYVITGSSQLTGSYNSAKIGEKMFLQKYPKAEIIIIDSKSGCSGETLLAYKIIKLEKAYNNFKIDSEKVKQFIQRQEVIFVLEDITFLKQNGRLTGIKALLATALNIVPILNGDKDGVIRQLGKARGIKRALKQLKDIIIKGVEEGQKETLVISHCNCPERAAILKNELIELFPSLKVIIADTGGIATLYAGNGGIVVSY